MVSVALRVSYHADESGTSLLSRLAAANHVQSVAEFGRLFDISPREIERGDEAELRSLFALAGFDPDAAGASQPTVLPNSRRGFSFGSLPSLRVARAGFRFCPHCLKEDMDAGVDRPDLAPYHRLLWLLFPFRTCPKHGAAIIQVPNRNRRSFDFLGSVRPYLSELDHLTGHDVGRHYNFEAYLQQRAREGHGGSPLPDALGVHGLITACEALGQVAKFGPTVRKEQLDQDDLAVSTNAGFDILSTGASGLGDFLASLEPEKESARKAGIYRCWGRFYTVVMQYRGDDLEPVKEVLRSAILRRYPKKAGSTVLDKRVTAREVHTVQSASRAAGISPKTLVKLFNNDPTLLSLSADIKQASAITDEVLGTVLGVTSRLVKHTEATEALAVSRNQLKLLVRHDFVRKMPGLDDYYDKATIDRLLDRLREASVPSPSPPSGSWSLLDAIGFGLSTKRALELTAAKKLTNVWLVESEVGLRQFWVDRDETRKAFHPKSTV